MFITNSQSLVKLMSIESVMPSNRLILCRLSPSPPAFTLSQHQGFFKWISSWHQVAKVLEFQLQHQSFQKLFRTDFLSDWLDSQESSLTPQFKSINSSALSFLYSPTCTSILDYRKNHSFTRWTLVGKVMSLFFNMFSRLVIAFLPRSKHLLISWLQSPSAVILEPKKIKSLTVSIVSPSICHEVMGLDAMILVFECWGLIQLFHSPLSLSSRGSSVLLRVLP